MRKVRGIYLVIALALVALIVLGVMAPQPAEASTEKERELEEVRAAIRALPAVHLLTEEDRPAVLEAKRLAENWLSKYNGRLIDLCVLSGKLSESLERLGISDIQDAPVALPPTGGSLFLAPLGLLALLAGVGILIPRKQ